MIIPFLFTAQLLYSQDTVVNKAFKAGEYLKYRVYYSSAIINATAGEAILTVKEWEEKQDGENKEFYRITGLGNSKGMFNWFYKVEDKFESFVDINTLLPYAFVRKTHEGKFIQNDLVIFNRKTNEAIVNYADTFNVPTNVHDFVSALYFMRTLNVEDFNSDSLFLLNFFLDDSVYMSAVKYEGKVDIKTKWGKVTCLKIAPMMASGEVFSDDYPMYVYVSDDKNHVPILAESKVIVGSIKMKLIEYDGLVSPLKIRTEEQEISP
ncbi:MAG: DUF3108 domain-containing protein [Bacteroidales bacterium]|nr:DUF3108 domain-containing protein [Bacteroidales bacterium]